MVGNIEEDVVEGRVVDGRDVDVVEVDVVDGKDMVDVVDAV